MKRLLILLTAVLATSMGLLAQGTTWQTATLISNGATKTGTLDSSNGEHWYKINVTQEGTVNLTATATETLTLSTSGSYVAGLQNNNTYSRGSFSGSGYGSVTVTYQGTDMGTGTYYIRVCRYNGAGSYSLKYTFTPCPQAADPEPNDDYEHSSLLESGKTVEGRLGYRTSDGITDTDDWYRIDVPEEGQIEFLVTATGGVNLYAYYCTVNGYKDNDIYDRGHFTGNLLPGPGSKSDTITFKATDVGAGTYYIQIHQYPSTGSGGYRLYYKFTPCPQANDPELNNDYEHTSLLESGKTVEGRLGYRTSDDVTDIEDWYRIDVPEEGQIELMATVATGTVRFYPSQSTINGYKNNNIYSRGSFKGNTSSAFQTDTMTFKATDVGPGTYYIRINRYNSTGGGGYRLYYKFTPCSQANDPEPNNDYEHTSLLESGKTVEGRLGYRTSDDFTDIEDWYRIVVPEEGQIELMATVATGTMRFYPSQSTVYGYKNNDIYSRGSFTGNTSSAFQTDTIRFKATDIGAGTYYIRIYRYNSTGAGGYRLYYKFTPCVYGADPEPNNDYLHASRLMNGVTTEGRLGYRASDGTTDTEDWYRITVPKVGHVEFDINGFDDVKLRDCAIYTLNGTTLTRVSNFSGNNSNKVTFEADDFAKNTYYIKVGRYSGVGGYSIRYDGPISDIPGDVDGDGLVTIGDVTDLIDFLLKADASSTLANADVDGDGEVTIGDVADLIDILLGFNH